MQTRKAILIILFIAIVGFIIFTFFYFEKQYIIDLNDIDNNRQKAMEISLVELNDIIKKKNNGGELTDYEEKQLKLVVDEKILEKMQELRKIPEENIKKHGYTQNQVDFILNPNKTIEKELGIEYEEINNPLTEEEAGAILNSTK